MRALSFGEHHHCLTSLEFFENAFQPFFGYAFLIEGHRVETADQTSEEAVAEQRFACQKAEMTVHGATNNWRIEVALMIGEEQDRPLRRNVAASFIAIVECPG